MRAQHLTPAAKGDLGEQHLALHRRALARHDLAERHDARAVLVAQRQQEQEILDAPDARRAQPLGLPLARRRASAVTGLGFDRLAAQAPPITRCDDALDFDLGTARQRGDADGGTRRIGLAEIFRHDLVDHGEMGQIGEVTFALTTSSSVPPAAVTIALRFSNTWRTCASMPPGDQLLGLRSPAASVPTPRRCRRRAPPANRCRWRQAHRESR